MMQKMADGVRVRARNKAEEVERNTSLLLDGWTQKLSARTDWKVLRCEAWRGSIILKEIPDGFTEDELWAELMKQADGDEAVMVDKAMHDLAKFLCGLVNLRPAFERNVKP